LETDSTRMWEIENVASHTDPNYKVARLAVSKFQPAFYVSCVCEMVNFLTAGISRREPRQEGITA